MTAPPDENREVRVYDHFAGDNSSLKSIIEFKRKNCIFYLYFFVFGQPHLEYVGVDIF